MAKVAVNKNGTEVIAEELTRCGYDSRERILINDGYYTPPFNLYTKWACLYDDPDEGFQDISIELPKGSIKKLIGRDLTWEDDAVEL